MRRIAVTLMFVAPPPLLLVSTYTVATGTPLWGGDSAQVTIRKHPAAR